MYVGRYVYGTNLTWQLVFHYHYHGEKAFRAIAKSVPEPMDGHTGWPYLCRLRCVSAVRTTIYRLDLDRSHIHLDYYDKIN